MMHRSNRTRLVTSIVLGALALFALSSQARAQAPTIVFDDGEGMAASGNWIGPATDPYLAVSARTTNVHGLRSLTVYVGGMSVLRVPAHCFESQGQTYCDDILNVSQPFLSASYAEGRHTVTARVVSADGTVTEASKAILVDNSQPGAPEAVQVQGGVGWRADRALGVAWTNPAQRFAPIVAARYRLCPAAVGSSDPRLAAEARARCVSGESSALTSLPNLTELPAPGLWTLRLWLVDAAKNANEETGALVNGLGWDPTPPQVTGFVAQDPNDPARVTVAASDDGAPITGGSIEVRRRGRKGWLPLPTTVTSGGVSALVDDETLRRGRYKLRATVINAAGLQQGTDRGADGSVKSLALPIRMGSQLQAGRRVGKVCRRVGKQRRCRFKLAQRVPVEMGRPITLRARLRSAGRPIANQPLELWERATVAGAKWTQIAAVPTDKAGRLRYKAPPGVARKLRFRYPGTPHLRGDNATIRLDVQAKSTIGVSRRNVINGEYVTFRGQLKGRPVPATGVLVELQVRSRGKWRTFAQPRANAKGAWRYEYRFETVRGAARYRFRARVRRQAGYPYATGSSRQIGVRVHGL